MMLARNITGPILLAFLMFLLPKVARSDPNYVVNYCQDDAIGNYTKSSTYETNLNLLLQNLTAKSSINGFYNSTVSEDRNKVYGLFYCRGDIEPSYCHECVQAATENILIGCPNQKEAIIWYEECTLRYANRLIFSKEEETPLAWSHSFGNVSDPLELNQLLPTNLDAVINQAAFNVSLQGFSKRDARIDTHEELVFLAQCTPDILGSPCYTCLQQALTYIQTCCGSERETLMIFTPSCQLFYQLSPYYTRTHVAQSSEGNPQSFPGKGIWRFPLGLLAVAMVWHWNSDSGCYK